MILSDFDIVREIELGRLVIDPFVPHKVSEPGRPSHGVQSGGYDLRLGRRFLRWPACNGPLDLRDPRPGDWVEDVVPEGGAYLLPAYTSALGEAVEFVRLSPVLSGDIWGKSTYARQFVHLNTTIIEPGWEGHPTLEITNMGCTPVYVFPGHGIAQLRLHRLSSPPRVAYVGRYQGQAGLTVARAD